ncbi:MAG: ABC transporter substrate-binding protein [Oscillospiraceae bacterium]|nr:ABC transporter substrate-binding protein [Oscillospiraceae bacterium]
MFPLKKAIRKAVAAGMSAAIIVSVLSSCSSGYNEERQTLHEELYGNVAIPTTSAADVTIYEATTRNFTLAYSKTDSLNPYKSKSTLNAAVSNLIYDKLFVLDSNFDIEYTIAKDIKQDGKEIVVTLKPGIVFSDGTPVEPEDIGYSYVQAKKSGTKYETQLANFRGYSSKGATITFVIKENDPMAHRLLDIPIIKRGTDRNNAMPVGSGRYVYLNDVDHGMYLQRNEKWYNKSKPLIERISLSAMPTIESIVHSIEIGTISYYYTDLRDGYPSRINADSSIVDINNLIYMGINTADSRLANFKLRRGLSLALDRMEIASKAYGGRALPATGPITSSWATVADAQSGSPTSDSEGAKYEFDSSGFVNADENGIRYDSQSKKLEFSILVCKENQFHMSTAEAVSDQLSLMGISTVIYSVPFEEFKTRLKEGKYQLYISEYAVENNMDISKLFLSKHGLYYGPLPAMTVNAYNEYLAGRAELTAVIDAFNEELPFIPICYRLGMVCYTRSLSAAVDVSESDPFLGMERWESTATVAEQEDSSSAESTESAE